MPPSDDSQDRSLPPSQLRLAEARRAGRVPRSAHLTAAASLVAGAAGLVLAGPAILRSLTAMLASGLSGPPSAEPLQAAGLLWPALMPALGALAALAAILVGVTLTVGWLQVGWLWAPQAAAPDWGRILPSLGRVISADGLARAAVSLLKILAVAMAAWMVGRSAWQQVLRAGQFDAAALAALAGGLVVRCLLAAGVMAAALGTLDLLYQRWRHRQSLRMTPQQARQDQRQTEGDPAHRRRVRQAGRRAIARGRSGGEESR